MAGEALNRIDTHIQVCERDNEHIKETLSRQDKLLMWIVGLLITALGAIALLHLESLGHH